MSTADSLRLERLSTGNAALDRILGGGIPSRSVTTIAGEPGTGKTVITLQMLFHFARQGLKCIYFTTLSEPSLKLIRYMQLFKFFDVSLLDDQIVFADLGSTLRSQGAEAALAALTERAERENPQIVVIDSFKAIHDFLGEPARSRAFVYDLAVRMSAWGATTFLLGEYTPDEIATLPEFAVADGIVRLANVRRDLVAVRQMEVMKLRGADYITGSHFFEIGPDGACFYPRVTAPIQLNGAYSDPATRLSTGIAGLDDLLNGGVPRQSATMVEGGTGTGKTLLGLHFVVAGALRGEPGILFTFEETPAQLRRIAANFGWDLAGLEDRGLVRIEYTAPLELTPDKFLDRARQIAGQARARRAVVDSLTSLRAGVFDERRTRELTYALIRHLSDLGVTMLLTQETPELLGSSQLTGYGISSIADNVVRLRYVEIASRLERALSVIKARGIRHSMELRRLTIGDDGARVEDPFRDLRGVLTGIPSPVHETGSVRPRERDT